MRAGFLDEENRLELLSRIGDPLQQLAPIDWETYRPALEEALAAARPARRGPGGRPAYDAVLIFRILVLQALYGLSDDRAEFLIADRLSFQRFVGLSLADRVPDGQTIGFYRRALTNAGVLEPLLRDVLARLRPPRGRKYVDETLRSGGEDDRDDHIAMF